MLKHFFLAAAIFWTGLILFFCLIKSNDIPTIDIQNLDKVIHSFFYFVFTVLWFLYFKKKMEQINNSKLFVIAFISSFFFGIAIELMQEFFTTTRTADVFDVLANMTGSTLAILSILVLNKYNGLVDRI